MKRWYAVYTKPGGERLAEGHLLRQGFEAYLPRLAMKRRHARRVTSVTVPLFPRYLFVALDIDAAPWRSVNGTIGVVRLVAFGDRPAAVPDDVIDEIRAREREDGVVDLQALRPFEPGEAVDIVDGPFRDRTGIFQCRTASDRVVVLLNLLGRDLPVQVEGAALAAAG